jgi:hypothetical protein
MKSKTLRYVIIPDSVISVKQLEEFVDKIRKLSTFLSKYCNKGTSVAINVDETAFQHFINGDMFGQESAVRGISIIIL